MTRARACPPGRAASRPFDFVLWLGLPLCAMAVLLAVETTAIDFALANRFYDPGIGFAGRRSVVLEAVLHRGVRGAMALSMAGVLLVFAASLLHRGLARLRRPLGYLLVAVGLSTGIIAPLKAATAVQCPWNLAEFGGTEAHSPLLGPRPATDHPGRCWPGGHASNGFALLALFFLLRDTSPRAARLALAGALAAGALLSAVRMVQGAHFLSHNLWTLLLDWTICAAVYRWMLYRPAAVDITCASAPGA
ncbi:PAP2 superfamily protein [Pigmentiphaga humi]|uniref:PAP2 superfamily protein n=1 Tax=Pigmentiphaga humi TaxID=2478468 RepID=A0A3P4B174_9BURK|nr:phosphatase PAP2 family protein [Pigmentiphaga humi]VCU69802.1 PAP2 superfamily protein [Pigmentiphaga humi]